MPPQPLYSEPASIPGSVIPSVQQMHTHSNKFPIEREVILSNYDKNSKIPILNEYHRKQKSANDNADVQMAWTGDRINRAYSDVEGSAKTHVENGMNIEYHKTYKAQALVLETTNGTEPSPIIPVDDENRSPSDNHSKPSGRSHSTPETEPNPAKAFSSRTYHTIKDMISSRFNNKSNKQTDQVTEPNFNNICEGNETPKMTTSENNHLSPHSELVQRGVYLASLQPSNRNLSSATLHPSNAIDMAKRNQQDRDRDQIACQYRERGIDVGQTAGVAQQATMCDSRPAQWATTVVNCETPNRYRKQPPVPRDITLQKHGVMESRSSGRLRTTNDEPARTPHSWQLTAGVSREMCENQERYATRPPTARRQAPVGCSVSPRLAKVNDKRPINSQLPADIKYTAVTNAMDRCGISRTRSNDHLLEATNGRNPYAHKDLPMKQKSKSFENLGNNSEDELHKLNGKSSGPVSGISSDYEKHRCGGQSDSGRGSTIYSSGKLKHTIDTSPDSSEPQRATNNKNNQWSGVMENELKQILEPKLNASIANSILSDSSASPPLPPVSPYMSSDEVTPSYKHKSLCSNKADTPYRICNVPSSHSRHQWSRSNTNEKVHQRLDVSTKRMENSSKIPSTVGSSSIDLDSMLDEGNTSEDELSISDTRAIRKQLEGLENMYSEVMKLLGVRKSALNRYQCYDPRMNKRRLYGSVSSLPSSISSRPVRERHRGRTEDRKKFVRDIKGINKRFQRLESHVVTLARSVAHLSSEMRTQHLMIQEMEVIRNELQNLRAQTNMLTVRSHSMPRFRNFLNSEQLNSSPEKMKKLTKFFGDEPPLLRLFLKKLGYEKYATVFENERIGLAELPYMSEERLQKLGIPMGPRLRIIQEAQLDFPGTHENTLCIV